MEHCPETPLFTFGVIADIQYADIDNGWNFAGTRQRYYRSSLQLLRNAIGSWSTADVKPSFILQLGDIIDGFNKRHDASKSALETVMREFSSVPVTVHHVWGNHEFYNFTRDTLFHSKLNSTPSCGKGIGIQIGDIYAYHFSPAPRFRFIVLDAYDVSLLGREESDQKYINALNLIKQHNSNADLNQPPVCSCLEQRFTMFNGGFSKEQLDWLDAVLTLSDDKEERVTIVSHLPVHPASTEPVCLAWNHDELLALLRRHGSVACFMAGHDHEGGRHVDEGEGGAGVHHLTLEGVIETPPDGAAHGTVWVYPDRMVLKGSGRIADREIVFP